MNVVWRWSCFMLDWHLFLSLIKSCAISVRFYFILFIYLFIYFRFWTFYLRLYAVFIINSIGLWYFLSKITKFSFIITQSCTNVLSIFQLLRNNSYLKYFKSRFDILGFLPMVSFFFLTAVSLSNILLIHAIVLSK